MSDNSSIIIDTGFFIALGNVKDKFHVPAKKIFKKIQNKKWITTWPVLTETSHLLSQVSQKEYHRWIDSLSQGLCEIYFLTSEHLLRIQALTIKYQDLPMDLADASLVVLAEEMNHGDIVSTDQRDFQSYRWKTRRPFRNLLLE